MFDIGWSELFVIAVVAVVVVGPKDLPKMLRTFGNSVGKMKRMAGEFQRQFAEALREAELDSVQREIEEIGKIDPMAEINATLAEANQMGADIVHEMNKPIGETAPAPAAAPEAVAGTGETSPAASASPLPAAADKSPIVTGNLNP